MAQFDDYQKSLLEYWEVKNVMDTSFEEGMIEGEYKGIRKVAKALKDNQVAIKVIMATTGLSEEEIDGL